MDHLTTADLEAGLDRIRRSPAELGRVELIVRRPAVDEREVLDEGRLDRIEGLVGDTWIERPSRHTDDGSAHPGMQLTLMNARAAALIAGLPERRILAGDQLFVDLDLSITNLPPGTRLAVGTAVLEVTERPHTGCKKFTARYGLDAFRFVNSPVGLELRLRGMNTRVLADGTVCTGDPITKVTVG